MLCIEENIITVIIRPTFHLTTMSHICLPLPFKGLDITIQGRYMVTVVPSRFKIFKIQEGLLTNAKVNMITIRIKVCQSTM